MLLDDAVLEAESDVLELHAMLGDAVLPDDALLEVGIGCFETAFRMLEVAFFLDVAVLGAESDVSEPHAMLPACL